MAARPLLPGNLIVPLVNGVEACPAMLEAIESATESIGLATYIFDGAGAGERFVDALARSKERGVEVRVLIDAVGANYSWPPVSRSLRDHGLAVSLWTSSYERIPISPMCIGPRSVSFGRCSSAAAVCG